MVAAFDGGAVSAAAGALLLGAADRAIGLVDRFGVCFEDGRAQEQVVHRVRTLVAQRVDHAQKLEPQAAGRRQGRVDRRRRQPGDCPISCVSG